MAQKIGYQDGIDWFVGFLRKIPGVKYRPVGDRPVSLEQWYGLEKFERFLRIVKDDHDAQVASPAPVPPQPEPEPPAAQTYKKVAPRVAYEQGGSNARFLLYIHGGGLQPGVSQRADGKYTDESRAVYTDLDGREDSNIRSPGPAATGAREMDNRALHELPLIGDPTKNTGSWQI